MNSTEPSPASSKPERTYRGPEYLAALGDPARDPLLHADPMRPALTYRVVMALVRWLVRLLFRFRIAGQENLPPAPFIIASNHQAWFDAAFVIAAFPKRPVIYTMARYDTVFNTRWKRWLMPKLGVFPILPNQGELDQRGVASVYRVLAAGGVVLMFPEGGYSRGRSLKPLRKGVAHFALQAGVPICPVAVTGADRIRFRGPIQVTVGPPVRPDPPPWWAVGRRVDLILERVRGAISRAIERPWAGPRRVPSLRSWRRRVAAGMGLGRRPAGHLENQPEEPVKDGPAVAEDRAGDAR